MDQTTRSDMIDLIMQWRFPKRKLFKNAITAAMINVGAGFKRPHSSTYSYVEQSDEYKRELLTKSSEELADLHQQALAEQEREEQARLDKLASFAKDARASADFSRWGRAAYWTSAEATALSLGKDPRVVNWQAFVSRRAAGSTLAGQYHDRHFLLQRALPQESDRPLIYIEWGKKLGIEFPPELEEVVVAYRDASLEAAPASAEIPPDSRQKRKAGRRNLYDWKWIEGMARHVHGNLQRSGGYDSKPGATQAMLIKAIQKAIESKGLAAPGRSRLQEKLLDWRL
jgi:hypothetical protein